LGSCEAQYHLPTALCVQINNFPIEKW